MLRATVRENCSPCAHVLLIKVYSARSKGIRFRIREGGVKTSVNFLKITFQYLTLDIMHLGVVSRRTVLHAVVRYGRFFQLILFILIDSLPCTLIPLTMAQPLEDDTLEKIHSYVKDMDINGTYVDMTEQLLMFRPENPIRFMIDYLSFKHKDSVRARLLWRCALFIASWIHPSFLLCSVMPRARPSSLSSPRATDSGITLLLLKCFHSGEN